MPTRVLTVALILLSLLGLADSVYLSYTALTNTALTCNIKGLDGCNTVAQSVYSHLFGIPLAVYGVLFYALIAIVAIAYLFSKHTLLPSSLAVLGTIGLVASIIFEGIQVFLIKAICVYCLGSAIISLFICIIAFWIWKKAKKNPISQSSLPATSPTPFDEKALP